MSEVPGHLQHDPQVGVFSSQLDGTVPAGVTAGARGGKLWSVPNDDVVPSPATMTGTYIAVVGPDDTSLPEDDEMRTHVLESAYDIGRTCAKRGAFVVCGGLGGVMRAACRGAVDIGGITIGILPGSDRQSANDYVTIKLPTGLGELRNALVVQCSDALIAVGSSWGTLSEIALAMRAGLPVVAMSGWNWPPSIGIVRSADEAVQTVLEAIRSEGASELAGDDT